MKPTQQHPTFLIAELGQNHNGSLEQAKRLIDAIPTTVHEDRFDLKLPGFNAVKLVKRDLAHEATRSHMNAPYDSPHAYGRTYGEHRRALELTAEQHAELASYARERGLHVVETVCSSGALADVLRHFTPDALKVASRDLTNDRLLRAIDGIGIETILSTGMYGLQEIDYALEQFDSTDKLALLHCTSEYPTPPEHVDLLRIRGLMEAFPDMTIGFSDHTIGISAAIAAVALGAQIVEKHVTLDRRDKGTDHAGSLAPKGMHKFARDVRLLELSKGTINVSTPIGSNEARDKLARSVAATENLSAGTVLSEDLIEPLSPGTGIPWHKRQYVVGKVLTKPVSAQERVRVQYFDWT